MKKNKFIIVFLLIIFIGILGNNVYATNETKSQKLLYQDVTINVDGSIKVKEAIWLNGDYNGANRKIEFKNIYAYAFTGISSNFSGDSDIYDATEISDIKVFDISQSNFKSINDINNREKEFKEVKKAFKGNYGVYTVTNKHFYSDIAIYCPSTKEKVLYIEYVIKNAVVVHNDVAELYWCFVENESSEAILDYKLIVHLPQKDKNVMVWSHGPSTGNCSIIDYQALSLTDTNIAPRQYETLRIMFNKDLVPYAEKKSNVNGKKYIIQYETSMADEDVASKLSKQLEVENKIGETFLRLEEHPSILYYNEAIELLNKLTWNDSLKKEYQKKLNNFKQVVNENWKKSLNSSYSLMINHDFNFTQRGIDSFIKEINEGFDEEAKLVYYSKANELQQILNQRKLQNKRTLLLIIGIGYYVLGTILVLKLINIYFENKKHYKKYYRDFPSNDNAYIIDYLMNKKITTKTFLVTILDLIAHKKILLETNSNDLTFILPQSHASFTSAENIVVNILFNIIGKNNRCSMNNLKNYGTDIVSSNKFILNFKDFEKRVIEEINQKEYFKNNKFNKILKIIIIIYSIISSFAGLFLIGNGYISVLVYYIIITVLGFLFIKLLSFDKERTQKGTAEYANWLAHKRFLNDFGRFQTKDLPEIIIWERYFVTAVTLGCSNEVLKKMEITLMNTDTIDDIQSIVLLSQNISIVNNNVNSLISNAKSHSTVGKLSSGSGGRSSGGGFGGGSSSGGSGGGGGGWSRF